MKLLSVSGDRISLVGLRFESNEGECTLCCLLKQGQTPSCDLWVGASDPSDALATPVPVGSEQQRDMEALLDAWVQKHISADHVHAFEEPGMHIRMTDEERDTWSVWLVLDALRNRHRKHLARFDRIQVSPRT